MAIGHCLLLLSLCVVPPIAAADVTGKVVSIADGDTNGVDCNLRQVEHGLAWHYKQYVREQPPTDRIQYDAAEAAARRNHLGLWQDPVPVPPWEFRRRQSSRLGKLMARP